MTEERKIIDTDIFGNIWLILSTSLIVFLIIIFFLTDNSHTAVMLSIAISSILVIIYWIYSHIKPKKEADNKK